MVLSFCYFSFLGTLRPVYTGEFCRAEVASSFEQVRNSLDIAVILSALVYTRANSQRFHGDFIAATLQETSCNFGATKIALSCATKIAGVNGPLRVFVDDGLGFCG